MLEEFDKDEDMLKKKYAYNPLDTTSLHDINTYLDLSLNTNINGVLSNVITKDGFLLIAHRNKGVVDNSTLYPSFNGHSEIYDPNVEFYNESTYEDLPTITLLNENRLDFKNEFSREMYSELSISVFEKSITYFGLSVHGVNQELWKKNNPGEININRRLHFNLLATHTSNKLIDEILSIWKDCTEAFENDFIYGIKIIKCSNVFILIKDIFLNFITLLRKSKEFIVSILTIIVAISTATFININDSIPSQILAIFNWIFLVIVLVLSVTNLIYFLSKKI